MSSSDEGGSGGSSSSSSTSQKRLRGIRRRKWGKWVSEIRVPGTQDRLWLGTYSSPEAAAVAHDIAKYCLKENTSMDDFNFPLMLPAGVQKGMSPRSVQKVATDAAMAIDAQFLSKRSSDSTVKQDEKNGTNWGAVEGRNWQCSNDDYSNNVIPSWDGNREGKDLDISVDDYL